MTCLEILNQLTVGLFVIWLTISFVLNETLIINTILSCVTVVLKMCVFVEKCNVFANCIAHKTKLRYSECINLICLNKLNITYISTTILTRLFIVS